jgi:hypothetical protein
MKSIKSIITIILIIGVFFSGCVSVDVNQKIYRDESIDISIKFSAESSYVMSMLKEDNMMDMLKQEITKYGDSESEWTYTENFDSFTFSSEHLDLSNKLDDTATKHSILKPEITKEFKFPYYYYTYSFVKKDLVSDDLLALYNFNELIYIDYNVEVFGKIVDTNGLKINENEVLFKMSTDSNQNEINYITFKDIFLRTWLKI